MSSVKSSVKSAGSGATFSTNVVEGVHQPSSLPAPDTLTLEHLTSVDLKQMLHNRNLSTYGDRKALVDRLTGWLREDLPTEKVWVAVPGIVHRRGASAVVYQDVVYMFGGLDNNNQDHNSLIKWSSHHPEFQEVSSQGPKPSPRWTSATAVHQDSMYLFGGFYGYGDQDTGRLDDLWRFNFTTGWWNNVETSGTRPFHRSHHTMSVHQDLLVVFGGCDEQEQEVGVFSFFEKEPEHKLIPLKDVHLLDIKTSAWIKLDLSGVGPTGGLPTQSTVFRGYLYTLGWTMPVEAEGGEEAREASFEMWRLELPDSGLTAASTSHSWEKVYYRGTVPIPRDSYSSCVVDQAWYMHGGRGMDGTKLLADTWVFDFNTSVWSNVEAKGIAGVLPEKRYSHKAVALNGNMLVMGGGNAHYKNSIQYQCTAMEQLFLKRPAPPLEDDSDVAGDIFQTAFVSEPKPLPLKHKPSKVVEFKSKVVEFTKVPSLVALIKNPGSKSAGGYNTRSSGRVSEVSAVSDAVLVADGMRIHAHQNVLAAQSTKFANLFAMPPKEVALRNVPFAGVKRSLLLSPLLLLVELLYIVLVNIAFLVKSVIPKGGHNPRVLRIQDIPYAVLLVILQYMYNCLEEIDENMLMDVFKASKAYGMASLHNDCFQHLKSMIDLNNVGRFLELADQVGDDALYTSCVYFCAGNWDDVTRGSALASLSKQHPAVAKKTTADVKSLMSKGGGKQF